MAPQHAKSSLSSAATATTIQGRGGGVGGGEEGTCELFSGAVLWFAAIIIILVIVNKITPIVTKFARMTTEIARNVAAKVWVPRRAPLPEQPELAMFAESHLSTSKGNRARLRERLRVMNESHPELRDLTAANSASSEEEEQAGEEEAGGEEKEEEGGEEEKEEEEEVDMLEKEVVERLTESRRLAREDLQAARTSASDLRDALKSMREQLAAADEAEGKSNMERELLGEMEAFVEADIDAAILCDDDGSVGLVGLHALMAVRFRDQCEKAERKAKKINDKNYKDLATILRSKPGEDLSERSVEQRIAAIEAEREEEARALQVLVRQANEDTAAARNRVQGYGERYTAAERSLQREVEDKKKSDAGLSEMRDFINRGLALIQDIDDAKRAITAGMKMKHKLQKDLENCGLNKHLSVSPTQISPP